MAQLVEHDLAKVGVAGSNPVFRSRHFWVGKGMMPSRPFLYLAMWPSGKAGACKALIPGSNPGIASKPLPDLHAVEVSCILSYPQGFFCGYDRDVKSHNPF